MHKSENRPPCLYEVVTLPVDNTPKVEPAIGMTADEVEKSTWGYPDDINKTTTAYGTSEQWVYNDGEYDFKFIYLDDGVVTSIQN